LGQVLAQDELADVSPVFQRTRKFQHLLAPALFTQPPMSRVENSVHAYSITVCDTKLTHIFCECVGLRFRRIRAAPAETVHSEAHCGGLQDDGVTSEDAGNPEGDRIESNLVFLEAQHRAPPRPLRFPETEPHRSRTEPGDPSDAAIESRRRS